MQFSIRHLVVITLVSAFVFAVAKAIGLPGTVSVLVVGDLFAPSIVLSFSRGVAERRYRRSIASGLLLFLFLACMFTCGIIWGAVEVCLSIAIGTVFVWVPQLLFVFGCLFAVEIGAAFCWGESRFIGVIAWSPLIRQEATASQL